MVDACVQKGKSEKKKQHLAKIYPSNRISPPKKTANTPTKKLHASCLIIVWFLLKPNGNKKHYRHSEMLSVKQQDQTIQRAACNLTLKHRTISKEITTATNLAPLFVTKDCG